MANELNNHFVNISHIIKKTVFKPENFEHLKCFLDEKLGNRDFKIEYISPVEVLTLIDKLNPNKSSGLDRIGPNILKLCKDYIVQPLTTLINTSISTGIFPDLLKLASVVPLHTGGDKHDPYNFRPISLQFLK